MVARKWRRFARQHKKSLGAARRWLWARRDTRYRQWLPMEYPAEGIRIRGRIHGEVRCGKPQGVPHWVLRTSRLQLPSQDGTSHRAYEGALCAYAPRRWL